ncbi:cation:proton antiporter, partial [Sphingomonas bacterium]|uniref:cation:proton antiporter n=1 Tax=Sphingomonas bacterium TaxID=1895847 RepID=UPI0015751B09
LGAIVAPPDAAAAMAVLKTARPPHRIKVILGGESLLNDASALLLYRLAVGAAMAGGTLQTEVIAPAFLVSVLGSLVAGPVLAFAWSRVIRRVQHVPSSIIIQFVGTFGIWVGAERLGLSPILTIVTYALTTARMAPAETPAHERVAAYAVWETAVVVLNALAFVLLGLQLGPLIRHAERGEVERWAIVGGAVLATVIVMRLAWVMGATAVIRWREGRPGAQPSPAYARSSWQGSAIAGWCGMRGIVTVATALALPRNFPQHDIILFTAFAVTLGTLLIQGLTLRPLVLALDIDEEDPVEEEVRTARATLAEAGLDMLADRDDEDALALRHRFEEERRAAVEADNGDGRATLSGKVLRAQVLEVQRQRLLDLRRDATIGDDAFHLLEEELDFADLAVRSRL